MTNTLFTPENSAMLLIDHQVGTMGWVHSADLEQIKRNTLALARAAKETGMPLILAKKVMSKGYYFMSCNKPYLKRMHYAFKEQVLSMR